MAESKVMVSLRRHSGLARHDLLLNEKGFHRCPTRKTASGNSCKNLSAIQRSDQKLWPFSAIILVWRAKTASSTSTDSIGTTRKRSSGNYCKNLSAIQRSDQKLWPFSTIILVWRAKTASSTSTDSIGTTSKRSSGNYCKNLSAIQWSDQKLWPFSAIILV